MSTVLWTDAAAAAEITARALVETGAVHARPERPFVLTSGLASPVYIDCRRLISFPRARRVLVDLLAALVLRDVGFERVQAVAGGETAGIPFAAWLADRLQLPMLYVRKKPKGFGRDARIEGALVEDSEVLLVEDLTTDGGSKIGFAGALREAGARVADAAADPGRWRARLDGIAEAGGESGGGIGAAAGGEGDMERELFAEGDLLSRPGHAVAEVQAAAGEGEETGFDRDLLPRADFAQMDQMGLEGEEAHRALCGPAAEAVHRGVRGAGEGLQIAGLVHVAVPVGPVGRDDEAEGRDHGRSAARS